MTQVEAGDTVAVKYTGKLDDGEVFDSNESGEPLEFEVGAGMVIPGFDKAVLGLAPGESRSVRIPPEEAYGERRDELVLDLDRQLFGDSTIAPGMSVDLQDDRGNRHRANILDVGEKAVRVDLNHVLAGQALNFDVTVLDVDKTAQG